MRLLHGLTAARELPRGAVAAIGNFDGIHLGHRRIFQTAKELVAGGHGSAFVIITFEPHPLTVLRPAEAPPRLTTAEMKEQLLEGAGADYLLILPPEPAVLNLSAEDFWKFLRDDAAVAHLVEGATFRFGKGAKGTIDALRRWTADSRVELHVIESVNVSLLDMHVAPVSSSIIRFLISYGRMRDAAICLGRPYLLRGKVARGFGRGKGLGIPTANLQCGDQLIPADGVYAGQCRIDGQLYAAAVSIGLLPTFSERVRQIEAHLIGFDGDLYDRVIDVELLDWVREQRRFPAVSELVTQIQSDILQSRRVIQRDNLQPIAIP